MRRARLPLTIILAAATVAALLGVATTLTGPGAADAPDTRDVDVALAARFYAAVNEALRSGEATALTSLVAVDIAEHPPRVGLVPGRDGLVQALLATRALFPGPRIVVEELRATGSGWVTARLRVEGAIDGGAFGLAAPDGATGWGPLEVVRLAEGRVVERWGSRADPLLALPLGQAPLLSASGDATFDLVVKRVRHAPDDRSTLEPDAATRFVIVDGGLLTLTIDAEPGRLSADAGPPLVRLRRVAGEPMGEWEYVVLGRPVEAAVGDLLSVPPGVLVTMRNATAEPASSIAVEVWPARSPLARAPVDDATTATALGIALPASARLSVGRVLLAAGSEATAPAGERVILIIVEDGWIEVSSDAGIFADGAVVTAGESIALPIGVGARLRAADDAPASLLVVTIAAEGASWAAQLRSPAARSRRPRRHSRRRPRGRPL